MKGLGNHKYTTSYTTMDKLKVKRGLGISLLSAMLLASASGVYVSYASQSQTEVSAEAKRCTGSKNCKACKNCKYCKHCAKDGNSCGVCK